MNSSSGRVALQNTFLKTTSLKDAFVSDCFSGEETEGAIFEDQSVAL